MMNFKHYITCIDAHTAGEPLRIVTSGFPPIYGSTILQKRDYVLKNYDHLRKMIMLEPRGHSGMYLSFRKMQKPQGKINGLLEINSSI